MLKTLMILWNSMGEREVIGDKSKQATQVVLGGQGFSETDTGENNGYLIAEFKDKVFDPIVTRIATHVYNSGALLNNLEWAGGVMMAGLVIISIIVAYGYLRCNKLSNKSTELRQLQEVGRQI